MSAKDLKSAIAQMRKKVAPFKSQNNAIAEAIIAISDVVQASVAPYAHPESETTESPEATKSVRKRQAKP